MDGYYIPFGIASITIGIGLFIFYQTLTYSFKTIEGAFHNFVALQFICAGICWMIRREYGNEEHRKKTKQEKNKKKRRPFYDEWEKNATKTDFMVISEQMIMNIIHSGRNRRKMLMRNRIEAVILI